MNNFKLFFLTGFICLALASSLLSQITPCLISSNCDPTTSLNPILPYLWNELDTSCAYGSININRFLTRSVENQKLTEYLNNNNFGALDCDPPYISGGWGQDYCPENYCKTIKTFVDLKASFIARAYFGSGGHEHAFFPGDPYFEIGAQIVRDINYAFDCAGLMRPVIQCAETEVSNPYNFQYMEIFDGNGGVDRKIPKSIIDQYFLAYPEDLNKIDESGITYGEYYSTPRYFKRDRIFRPFIDDLGTNNFIYDITKVEMRLWFYYQACAMIDMGYTSIALGLYGDYGKSSDGSFADLYKLTNEIRKYARNSPTGFVLLSGETPMAATGVGTSPKYNDFLILDFESRAMRPRETQNGISGDGNPPSGCTDPIANAILADIANSPCGNVHDMAVIDPCSINSFGGITSGINPQGCYISQQPYYVHFDGFHPPVNPGVASNGPNSLTWGVHDHQWFSGLPPECKRWWFDYFYCNRKNYDNGLGSIILPVGIQYDTDFSSELDPLGELLMFDDPEFVKMLTEQTLLPKKPELLITEKCTPSNDCIKTCRGVIAPHGYAWQVGEKSYIISVGNKDCTSTYSFHIRKPDGTWIIPHIGESFEFFPETDGYYSITLRQDNLGLPASIYGTDEVVLPNKKMEAYCCLGLIPWNHGGCLPSLTTQCSSNDSFKSDYSFVLESPTSEMSIANIRIDQDFIQLDSLNQLTPQKIVGKFKVWSNETKNVRMFFDLSTIGDVTTTTVTDTLVGCETFNHTNNRAAQNSANLTNVNSLNIFPNPASNLLMAEFICPDETVNIQIINSLGQEIFSNQDASGSQYHFWKIETSSFPNGWYWISCNSLSEHAIKKVLISH